MKSRRAGTAVLCLAALLPPLAPRSTAAQDTPASATVPSTASTPNALVIQNKDLYAKSLQAAVKAIEFFGDSDDAKARERVADIGYRVAQGANYQDFPLTFHVVKMPEPNAFALPGGHIFVTTGMLTMGVSDDMLAGLLGHEIAHVTEHHGTRMQRRQTLLQVLGQALVVGVIVKEANSDRSRQTTPGRQPFDPYGRERSSAGSMVEGAAATSLIVSELLLRGYSRDFEREADDEGQRFAAAAGFAAGGLKDLMSLMLVRLPQSKEYGYWQTHPFFDERVRGAEVRAGMMVAQPARSTDELRQRTQATLLDYLADGSKIDDATKALLEDEALVAWPRGPKAEEIRLGRLHAAREEMTKLTSLSRDYGALLDHYGEQLAEVERLDPESGLVTKLKTEVTELETELTATYPQAQKVLSGEIYETAFLERFLSNFEDAPEVPRAALALGDAYSRLGKQGEAVAMYQRAAGGTSGPEPARAQQGLKVLAPILDNLAALETLVQGSDDELAALAKPRLEKVVTTFTDLAIGAEYLERFPEGKHKDAVANRMSSLADKLYTEVVLYQGVGDSAKAIDRINQILTHAPASAAAARIRDQAVVEG